MARHTSAWVGAGPSNTRADPTLSCCTSRSRCRKDASRGLSRCILAVCAGGRVPHTGHWSRRSAFSAGSFVPVGDERRQTSRAVDWFVRRRVFGARVASRWAPPRPLPDRPAGPGPIRRRECNGMSYGVVHQFKGGTKDQYEASIAAVHPSDGSLPAGQIFHAAGPSADGWTIVALHESKESWEAFRDGILMPRMEAGIPGGFSEPPQETVFEVLNEVKIPASA